MKHTLLYILLLISPFPLLAEDWMWWNIKHNWDQVSSWETYMPLSSKYMGPNAIPVPEITKGNIPKYSFLETGLAGHICDGDKVGNIVLNSIVRAGTRAAIGLYWVPFETYEMDTNTSRNIRNTRDYDGKGTAVGDVYITGYFQVLKQKTSGKGIDALITFGVRTASGNNLQAARFTDCPGYYFHLSLGKAKTYEGKYFNNIRYYVMAGAYIWQTYRVDYHQDDSFLWGLGMTLESKKFIIDEQLGGYIGYIKNGDRPIVNRLSVTTNRDKLFNYKLLFQYGFGDAPYKSLVLSSMLNLDKIGDAFKK
jgi:hypothetical protein